MKKKMQPKKQDWQVIVNQELERLILLWLAGESDRFPLELPKYPSTEIKTYHRPAA